MAYEKLPGVYFTETIGSVTTTSTTTPLFIIQTSTEIESIDEQYVKFTNLTAFKTVATDKGLTETINFIEETLNEAGMINNEFYVYSVKTDTAANFTKILVDSSHMNEIRDVFYFEETKSANANTINAKLGALKTGCNTCYTNGVTRIAYVVPYGTITDAVENKASGTTDEAACIAALTTTINGINSGRIACILPDYPGAVAGRILAAQYNEEIGYPVINTAISTPAYNFTTSDMISLQNKGILFIRGEMIKGSYVYRVNLGVSTAFSGNGADGLLLSRRVCDEVLNQVKYACDDFVKTPNDIEGGLVTLQVDIDNVLGRFIDNGEIVEADSELLVTEGSDVYTFNVSGQIKPIKSTIAINVNTNIA
jgi:hypothetical protein